MSRNVVLAKYIVQLTTHPLRTKAITSGVLYTLQEVLASHLARVPVQKRKDTSAIAQILARAHLNVRALKLGLYGCCIAAPLNHFLVGLLQKTFAGKTGPRARVAQILASNLLISPIQVVAYLVSVSIINGANSVQQVKKRVKAGFWRVISVTWVVSPLSIVIAQRFIPMDLWVPFFNLVQFVLGTLSNTRTKQSLNAMKKDEGKKDK